LGAGQWDITSSGHAYEALADAAKRLYERSIKSVQRNKRGDPVRERRWLKGRADYGEGAVTLEFNDEVLPYMTLLHEQFTSYQIKQVSQLSSFYAIRLYELCAQYKTIGERYLALEPLRAILDVGDKYQNVKDLRRCIIDPAMKEITGTSDLTVSATPRREGRKVIGFDFVIDQNLQRALL
jgi:plasmid replication initiation protein